jgi:RNA polymerase sigma-70 factor (ECF subfamily)
MQDGEFDDPAFLARLRQGDGAAFRALIRRFHGSLIGVAASIIGSRAQAEEVVQDAWLAVFSGIGSFEGRSSLVTWLFSIVLNRARTRASREGRLVGLPAVLDDSPSRGEASERAVPFAAFQSDGHWREPPALWDELNPERIIAGRQLWDHVQEAVEHLPPGQRAVIILRDIEGRSAEEACTVLEISAENQRVLLHRARARIRRTIDALLSEQAADSPADRRRPARAAATPISRCLTVGRRWVARLLASSHHGRPCARPCAGYLSQI